VSVPEHVLRAKEILSKLLLTPEGYKEGIWGVGITTVKYVAGQPQAMPEPGIVVFVRKKLPEDMVKPAFLVPKAIAVQDGGQPKYVWTDVIEADPPMALVLFDKWAERYGLTPIAIIEPVQECGCNTSRCRPVEAGLSVCDCELTACTATGLFRDPAGNTYLLTNAHCTKYTASCNKDDLINRPMSQPGPYDGGKCPDDVIGTVVKASDLTQDGATDTALIKLNQGVEVVNKLHGTQFSFNGKYREPNVGEVVYKSGRTSGANSATVQALHVDVQVDYRCSIRTVKDTIVTTAFLQPGDSGSPVVTSDGTFVGQGFAGSSSVSVLISPLNIVKEFGVEPVGTGQQPPPGSTITFTITFTSKGDPYLRYAGAWVDQDYGPDFWQKGQANLGTVSGVMSKTLTVPAPAPGAHKLYVRVSTSSGWNIAVKVDGQDLGSKDIQDGLAVFDFTVGQQPPPPPQERKPRPTSIKVPVRVVQQQPPPPPPPPEGEEVVIKTDKDSYEVQPSQTFQVGVTVTYKSDGAPVSGYTVYAVLANTKSTGCLDSSGRAILLMIAPDAPGDYEMEVGVDGTKCQ